MCVCAYVCVRVFVCVCDCSILITYKTRRRNYNAISHYTLIQPGYHAGGVGYK